MSTAIPVTAVTTQLVFARCARVETVEIDMAMHKVRVTINDEIATETIRGSEEVLIRMRVDSATKGQHLGRRATSLAYPGLCEHHQEAPLVFEKPPQRR